jgi:hypothetical protein
MNALGGVFKPTGRPLGLLLVTLLALILRTYDIGNPFYANDPAELPLYASYYYPRSISEVYSIFRFPHGPGYLLLGFVILGVYNVAGVHVTEFMWNIPYALIGVTTVAVVYIIALHLFKSRDSAFTAALLLALHPLHVGFTRSAGFGHVSLGLLFQITTIVLFYYYYLKPSRLRALPASLSLALTIFFDLFFPFILPVIIYAGVVSMREKDALTSISDSIRCLFRIEFIIPVSVVFAQLMAFMGYSGPLLYALSKPDASLGLHLKSYFINMLFFLGPLMMIACFASALYGIKFIPKKDPRSIIVVWFMAYSIPFLFMLDRCAANYVLFPITPLLILTGGLLGGLDRRLSLPLVAVFSILLLARTLDSVYGLHDMPLRELPKDFYCHSFFSSCRWTPCEYWYPGIIYPDKGYKAAAYWIRENTLKTVVVFNDHYGRQGRSRNIAYYLHRQITGFNIPTRESMLELFESNKNRLDVLLIRPENQGLFKNLNQFHKTLVIESQDKPLLLVYTRKKYYDKPLHAELREYNHLFDTKYTPADVVVANYPKELWV